MLASIRGKGRGCSRHKAAHSQQGCTDSEAQTALFCEVSGTCIDCNRDAHATQRSSLIGLNMLILSVPFPVWLFACVDVHLTFPMALHCRGPYPILRRCWHALCVDVHCCGSHLSTPACWSAEEEYVRSLKVKHKPLPDPGLCSNLHDMCETWAAGGECQKNPGFMVSFWVTQQASTVGLMSAVKQASAVGLASAVGYLVVVVPMFVGCAFVLALCRGRSYILSAWCEFTCFPFWSSCARKLHQVGLLF